MAVDSKYADLPGIDNQPDVYETEDLPEEDQNYEPDELSSESVERLKVNTTESFNKFKDANVVSGNSDFSDNISKPRRTGYIVPRTEYEMLEDGSSKETPVQKYQRLQHEIKQLAGEVEEIQKTVKDEKALTQLSPVGLSDQVTGLQEQLFDLHLEQILGTDAVVELSDPKGAIPKKLFNQLDSYKKQSLAASQEDSSKSKPATKDGHMTYELYHYPSRDQFDKVSKAAELEERLARLEALLGGNPDKVSYVTADTSSKTLLESVESLQGQVSMLDVNLLDHTEARIQNLLQKMDQIKEKSSEAEEGDKDSKISLLYDIVTKWDNVADSLPKVVDRLKALQELHEQALQFSQALSQLDTAQQQVTTGLQNQTALQKQLSDSFAANMAAIEANCKSLEERFKKIPTK
ncbi:dynactin subunit 2-like [Apostichopus japonicus]|uniref:dynactin subunit 2-like n=1 Tax=Stichopus japonicus TaxID=307972 RepID=UPI003AB90C4A